MSEEQNERSLQKIRFLHEFEISVGGSKNHSTDGLFSFRCDNSGLIISITSHCPKCHDCHVTVSPHIPRTFIETWFDQLTHAEHEVKVRE